MFAVLLDPLFHRISPAVDMSSIINKNFEVMSSMGPVNCAMVSHWINVQTD